MGLVRQQQTGAIIGEQIYFLLQILPIKPSYYLWATISSYVAYCISCKKEGLKEEYQGSQVAPRTLEINGTRETGAGGSATDRYRLNLPLAASRGSS